MLNYSRRNVVDVLVFRPQEVHFTNSPSLTFLFVKKLFCLYIWGKTKGIMSTSIIEEVSKLTKLEKIELARYLFDEITKEELEDDFELSAEQKADLDQAMVEIENGTADLYTGEEFSKELKEKYGITVSLP